MNIINDISSFVEKIQDFSYVEANNKFHELYQENFERQFSPLTEILTGKVDYNWKNFENTFSEYNYYIQYNYCTECNRYTFVIRKKFTESDKLGDGKYGEVLNINNERVMKQLKADKICICSKVTDVYIKDFKNEFNFLKNTDNDNIVSVYDYNHLSICFTMEKCEEIDWNKLTCNTKLKYVKDILNALMSIHSKGYVYADLHKRNIMVKNEKVKLIDFGRIKKCGDILCLKKEGEEKHNAPELYEEGNIADYRSDIYSLGYLVVNEIKIDNQEVVKVFEKAKSKEKDLRYQNVDELVHDFDNALDSADYINICDSHVINF